MQKIEQYIKNLIPLLAGLRTSYRVVRREETTCKRSEYCLLVYSEQKENFLLNVGYIMEQLDLWMASQNIGVCWYGKPDRLKHDGLDYVIMLAFGKGRPYFYINFNMGREIGVAGTFIYKCRSTLAINCYTIFT